MPVLWDITVFEVKVTVNSFFFFLSFLISLPIVIHGFDRFLSVLMIISSMSTVIEGNKTKYFNS